MPGTPKIAYSTLACPTWGWEEIVAAGIRHGYDGVEIRQVAGETDLLKVPAFVPAQRAASHELLPPSLWFNRLAIFLCLRVGLFRPFRFFANRGS